MQNILLSIAAGIFFGLWPILMNRSGLGGSVSAAAFGLISFLTVLPFALKDASGNWGLIMQANWPMAIGAGLCGGVGVLLFSGVLSRVTPMDVGLYFLLAMIVQILVPAVYHAVMNGGVSPSKAVGMVLALIAAALLVR